MNLFEAKRFLRNNGFRIIKESTGEVKVIIDFGIKRTSAARLNPDSSEERQQYHIMMNQIKKLATKEEQDAELKKVADPDKLGGARMYNQRVKSDYKKSYIWINPEKIQEEVAKFNLRSKVEYSQVDTETSEGDSNPYYEYGVDHLFPSEMVGDSCPYCYITYYRDYRVTLIGKAEDMLGYFDVENLEDIEVYADGYAGTWTTEYTVPCNRSGCDKHPKISEDSVKVQIIDSTDDDDIEVEEEEVERIVP